MVNVEGMLSAVYVEMEFIFKKSLRSRKSGDKIAGSAENGSAKCQALSASDSRKKVKNYLTRT